MAQTISEATACQKQSWAAECIQPDTVRPTDGWVGGGGIIESWTQPRWETTYLILTFQHKQHASMYFWLFMVSHSLFVFSQNV